MGGKVAMQLALSHGDAVGRLVVVDIAPVRYERSFAPYIEAMQQVDLSAARRSEVDESLKPAVPDAGVRAFLLQNLVSSDGGFAWRVNLPALSANMDGIMGFPESADRRSFEGPALFLAGGRSDYLRPLHRAEIERLFPRAEFEVIEDAGHWVHAERPADFLEALERFLERDG
jgi:pimeloyl-ACP methyl ester carboxylesterase